MAIYRIEVIFGGANFRIFNIRTAQHSDVEHNYNDIIVQGDFHFRMMLYNTKYTKITRYTVLWTWNWKFASATRCLVCFIYLLCL